MLEEIEALKNAWRDKGYRVSGVVVHPELMARQYIFSIDFEGSIYIAVNEKDLNIEIARKIMSSVKAATNVFMVCSLPVIRDEERVMKIMTGIFRWI